MIPLKYATASQEIPLGYFVDSTDGNTAEIGLTIANTDIQLWKSGATTLANKNSGGATHISGGVYYAVLDATDTDTYGPLKIFVHVSGALPVILECIVMEADAYDALYAAAGTGHIEADAVQISGDATAADNAESFFDGTGYAGTNNVIPTVTTVGTVTTNTDLVTAAAVRAEMDSNSTQLAAIVADTNELQTDDIPGAIAALNNISTAQVNTEVDTALADIGLDHLLAAAVAGTDITDDSIIAQLVSASATADWDDFDNTTESLQAIRDRGDSAWITGGGGGITDILNVQPLIPESIDLADTATWRVGLMLINSLDDLPTTAEITPGTIDIDYKSIGETSWTSAVSGGACSELAGMIYYDEVFDSGTGYAEGDSVRLTFKSQKITVSANDYEISDANGRIFYTEIRQTAGGASVGAIADAVLDEALSGHTTAGTLGKAIADIETDATAILADTNELQTDDIPGAIAALNNISTAEVNAEVDTALADIHLDHLLATDYDPASKPGTATALLNELVEDDGGVSRFTANALENAPGGDPWSTSLPGAYGAGTAGYIIGNMADTMWDEVINAGYPANAQTARELMRIFASALSGLTNNGTGSQFIARDLADSKDVITASIDANGFRTSMTLDGS